MSGSPGIQPPAWIDIWPEVSRGQARADRLAVVDCDWVSHFLDEKGIGHERATAEPGKPSGVVFLPASAVATDESATEVLGRYTGRAKVVLCGAPTSSSWLSAPGLVPHTVCAALVRDPGSDPMGWLGTCEKLFSGRVFSMRPYLSNEAEFSYFRLTHGAERHAVLEGMSAALEAANLFGRTLASITDAIEELMIRSLSAAAVVTGQEPTELDAVALPPRCEVRLTVGIDNETIGVSACDLFSHSVTDPAVIVGALRAVFNAQPVDGSQDIALVKAATAASHFVVNLANAGVCEIVCLVSRSSTAGRRGLALANRSFGVFIR